MSQFPWERLPATLGTNDEERQFFDDIRELLTKLYLLAEDVQIHVGNGTPEGVVSAKVGSLFLRKDGGATTTLYVKTSGTGNTGWTAK
ncbi:MAG: hypothetical protein ACRCZI_10980 [Cetobacterium sp.]